MSLIDNSLEDYRGQNMKVANKKIKFVPIVGLSGVGKDYFIAEVLKEHPDKFHFPKSTATRPCRGPNDNTHIFVTDEEFEVKMKFEVPVSYTVYGGYKYCTFLSEFDKEKINIRAIDPIGVMATMETMQDVIETNAVLLKCREEVRFYNIFKSVKEDYRRKHIPFNPVTMADILHETKKRMERDMGQYTLIPVYYCKKIERKMNNMYQIHDFAENMHKFFS